MNRIGVYGVARFKSCAGRGCKNIGLYLLRVRFVNKAGWFCRSCKNRLTADMLLEDVDSQNKKNR